MSLFESLLVRAKAGDPLAVEELLRRNIGGLRAFIRLKSGALLRKRESCSDLLQTVCRTVLESLPGVDCPDERSFRNWLFTVAHRRLINRVEFHSAGKRGAGRDHETDDELLDAYRTIFTPSRHAEVREEIGRIERAMDTLPASYRDVIVRACLRGESHREMAGALGRSELAVRKLLSRARARLAIELAALPPV